jgi:capsule polysaccharide export protein KpsE/RkpR
MLIYLDNCCFNRPFDDQKQARIRIETEAKLHIQDKLITGKLQLAWSYILDYENSANPFPERKETIENWKKRSTVDTDETQTLLELARRLMSRGIKAKDSLHIASSVIMQCEYFITTDDFLIKKLANFVEMKVVSPIDFINALK